MPDQTVHHPHRTPQVAAGPQIINCPPRRDPKRPDPCAIVIFGASGDLTKRLVVPALYNLARTGMLPENFAVLGVARSKESTENWRASLHDMLTSFVGNPSAESAADRVDEGVWKALAGKFSYVPGDLTDAALYSQIADALQAVEKSHGTRGNVIFYLAIADRLFGTVVEQLGRAGLTDQKEGRYWRRVVIEKPFGHSLESARALNAQIRQTLEEDQIFRIDHFLGKETVQNIMALRFANGMFEPIWNRDRIDHVQITAAETVGVETRGEFYEGTGALRDMVPNHVLSLLSMLAMEPPNGFDPVSIRNRKADLFAAMPAADPAHAVRGQYGTGEVLGKPVAAYRKEPKVAPGSEVETYVAMRLEIDNWRWAGVPFYIRTGKHLAMRRTEIAIRFKQAPFTPFREMGLACLPPNWLILGIAPDEGVSLQCAVKRPGPVVDLASVKMDFHYADWFPKEPNVGYETLLYDVMIGDPTLFMRADMIEQTWRIVQPVLDSWAAGKGELAIYKSGSDGPEAADALLKRDGDRAWRPLNPPAGQAS